MDAIFNYLIIAVLLFILELIYLKVAAHFNIVDKPNDRSSHRTPIIRGGAIIIPLSVWLWAAFFGWTYAWVILGVTLIGGISYMDDLFTEPKTTRLLIQFTAMVMLFHQHRILSVDMWWVVILELVFCVGVMNAFNFMDGINGILAAYSIVVIGSLIFLDSHGLSYTGLDEEFVRLPLLVTILLATVVFAFFNFRKKAICFAGDVGSVSMAFLIMFCLGELVLETYDISYIMLLAVFGVDVVMTMSHRVLLHENITEPHRKHAYQIMANELKIPHVVVSTLYAVLQLLVTAGLIFLPVNHYVYSGVVLVVLCTAYVIFIKKYYHLHEEYLRSIGKK